MKGKKGRLLLSMLCVLCSAAVCAGCSREDGESITPGATTTSFVLESREVSEGGTLPGDYTCDGTSSTLPLAWSGAPAGIVSLSGEHP